VQNCSTRTRVRGFGPALYLRPQSSPPIATASVMKHAVRKLNAIASSRNGQASPRRNAVVRTVVFDLARRKSRAISTRLTGHPFRQMAKNPQQNLRMRGMMVRRASAFRSRAAVVCQTCGKRGADVRPDFIPFAGRRFDPHARVPT
jgi:hypothetical protein